MDLDRQSIEKRDFPIGRRGYDPSAVDAHLEAVGREIEALKRQARSPRGESLASSASAQVQAIVEAAETSAGDIERQAQMEAARIRQDAQREADRSRDEAVERSRDHVGQVSEATAVMLQRVNAMESELGALFESLRTGANRLHADLSLLEGNMGELYAASGGVRRGGTVVPLAPASSARAPGSGEDSFEDPDAGAFGGDAGAPELAGLDPAEAVGGPGGRADGEGASGLEGLSQAEAEVFVEGGVAAEGLGDPLGPSDDVEGARLIALNMALNGQSREEADRYLAENFDLADRTGLLDEVFASVQG